MSIQFEAACDCGWSLRRPTREAAERAAALHTCFPHSCRGCGGTFPVLVEGSDMCLRCDILFYPVDDITPRRAA